MQEEVAQLHAALVSATAEREEMERRAAEAASALGAVQHLYAAQEQLAQREAELAAMHQERAQLRQQVGRFDTVLHCRARSRLICGCMGCVPA